MKTLTQRIALTLLLLAIASPIVSAKVKTRTMAFGQDFLVGEKVIKAGIYRLSFDDKTNELTILDNKTKEVVIKVAARLETREKGVSAFDLQMVQQGERQELVGMPIPYSEKIVRIGEARAVTTSVP